MSLSYGIRRELPGVLVALLLLVSLAIPFAAQADTTHKVYFKGTNSELDVYIIRGASPGPTLLLMGGIQGDEPGGYLAADLYADISLKNGTLIVVPRANFYSIVKNNRGVQGDMNRKFADLHPKRSDRDVLVVKIIKDLMKKSDFFLNLHDGSGFYSLKWESPDRNPVRYGQSIIADAAEHTRPDGRVIPMGKMVNRVLEKVNPQISAVDHLFQFNNHRTLRPDTTHKEQRLSATYHALTKVGIPAFGIETSKDIGDYRLRVRYQTMVINAFLDEFGIVPDNPKIYLDNPYLKYLIVSVNGRTPIVVGGNDALKVHSGDNVRIIHIESNYTRGLTARVKGVGGFNDLNEEVHLTNDTLIQVRKDRFLIGAIPVQIIRPPSRKPPSVQVEPKVRYFCIKVNDRTFVAAPGEDLTVMRGDTITLLDPSTNLEREDEIALRIDLRGFQVQSSPQEDRGHRINTATDLQEKYGRKRGSATVFPLQAKLNNKVIGESYIVVAEPRLEYLVMRESQGEPFVAFPGDKLELPTNALIKIMDVKTNVPDAAALFITMSGRTVRWQHTGSSTGIDASKLTRDEVPLDITRHGRSLGRIWIRQGKEFRLSSESNRIPFFPVRY